MKKLLTEINDTIRQNKFNYLIILLFLCIGIVFGVCSVKYMNSTDKNDLINYVIGHIPDEEYEILQKGVDIVYNSVRVFV